MNVEHFKSAFDSLIAKIPDVENFDEEINAVTVAVNEPGETDGEDWRSKYEDLQEKYRKRFVDMIEGNTTPPDITEPTETEEVQNFSISELDFDGSTES